MEERIIDTEVQRVEDEAKVGGQKTLGYKGHLRGCKVPSGD